MLLLSTADLTNASPFLAKPVAENLPKVTSDTLIDRALVVRFLANDETAFVEIMSRHREKIFAVAMGHLRNRADAEEVAQDTFIRAHRGLARFRGDSSLATWLYRIATNLARNRYWHGFRRHQQDAVSLDREFAADNASTFSDLIADPSNTPAQMTVNQEFVSLVERSMRSLEKRHRDILELRVTLNQSYEEIGAALSLNVGTVKSRLSRARESLRERMAETCPEFTKDATPNEWFLASRESYGHLAIACA
ncbi:MAG: polymerase, sigma-24 subunit, subfamily [Verrucomicrobia bacterium]|nr:polymerase, sigma-24 subunit, subfamily [Verrucomicrobiota bacterium]